MDPDERWRRFRMMARCLGRIAARSKRRSQGKFFRADIQALCQLCGLYYVDHPQDEDSGLFLLCNGSWVKL